MHSGQLLLAYCVTANEPFIGRMLNAVAQQRALGRLLRNTLNADRVLFTDAPRRSIPKAIREAFDDKVVSVATPYVFAQARPRFCLSKFRNASIAYALKHKYEWMMLCDCDTLICDGIFVPPDTKYGRPFVYWQKSQAEPLEDSLNFVNSGNKSVFSAGNSWFVLHHDLMLKLRFNEHIYGYGFEDIEFDIRAHAAGHPIAETGIKVIHLYHSETERAIDPVLHARNHAIVLATKSLLGQGYDPCTIPEVEVAFARHTEWSSPLCFLPTEKRVYICTNDAWGRYSFLRNDNLIIHWDNNDWPTEEFRLDWEPVYKLASQSAE